mmetsp:Transcript_6852/g.16390  ORF Transcript_6852/g.16390 Transcript_6852/m.16390 type:complete len:115 (+) Transcript_6852:1524-1868(+)
MCSPPSGKTFGGATGVGTGEGPPINLVSFRRAVLSLRPALSVVEAVQMAEHVALARRSVHHILVNASGLRVVQEFIRRHVHEGCKEKCGMRRVRPRLAAGGWASPMALMHRIKP